MSPLSFSTGCVSPIHPTALHRPWEPGEETVPTAHGSMTHVMTSHDTTGVRVSLGDGPLPALRAWLGCRGLHEKTAYSRAHGDRLGKDPDAAPRLNVPSQKAGPGPRGRGEGSRQTGHGLGRQCRDGCSHTGFGAVAGSWLLELPALLGLKIKSHQ